MRSAPPEQDLVLVGGGHAHALALRTLAMNPVPGLRITLISPAPFTPYSGMLPGLLAGHYRFEDAHIDLARLCQWGGVRFFADEVTAVDQAQRRVHCRTRGAVAYDILSLDIGSQPELDSVPGAREFSVPVKPVAGLWERWRALRSQGADLGRIAVVGGGAGSVEVALAMAHSLRDQAVQIDLYSAADRLLPGYVGPVQRAVERQCERLGVGVHTGDRVARVERDCLHTAGGDRYAFDTLIWSTAAAAAGWVGDSGIAVDDHGFMTVHDTLQSTADERVFGVGDIAVQVKHPRPRAGVYAVRQAPVLAANLRALALGEALREHRPQRRFLSLLSLGEQAAVAERNGLSVRGRWVWRWKDRIDREFMDRFAVLPVMPAGIPDTAPAGEQEQMPCGGCGAKVGGGELRVALRELRERFPAHAPTDDLDDSAVLDVSPPLLQSTDALRALVDDPWRMGRIAAQHALSDIYASGGRPHSALAQITLPFAGDALVARDLAAALAGALSVLADADCRLIGGHSMQGPEMQLGFTVNGVLDGQAPLSKRGAEPGDVLLLAKALGTGALFAAHMQLQADGRDIAAALAAMEQGNGAASVIGRRSGARAATDVTGFGLAGHLLEMLQPGQVAELELERVPVLDGALEAIGEGLLSTLHEANRRLAAGAVEVQAGSGRGTQSPTPQRHELLFDPQTSGGLLFALPPENGEDAERALLDAGYAAARIGTVAAAGEATGGARILLR